MARRIFIVCAILMLIAQTVVPASAGGPADDPSCLVDKKPAGSTQLQGTVAVHVQDAATNAVTTTDFTLRLSRGGALQFFRVSIDMQVFAVSNEGILCVLLRDAGGAAATTRAAILSAFGLSPSAQFFLISKSLSNAEIQGNTGQWFCNNTFTDTSLAPPCPAQPPRGGSMADVTLYVK
jgi:hypothetical protein